MSPEAKVLELVSHRYGRRPSQLLRLRDDEPLALDLDAALAIRSVLEEIAAMDAATAGGGRLRADGGIDAEDLTEAVRH